MTTLSTLTPRELAASAGISTDTLRYYERRGVLRPPGWLRSSMVATSRETTP